MNLQPTARQARLLSHFSCKPLLLAATVLLTGCAALQPSPLTTDDRHSITQDDQRATRQSVEPITAPLTLNQALARALKYNLDLRSRVMEQAMALRQLDVANHDMLPKLVANAGYNWRSNDQISLSRDAVTGAPSNSRFISQDRAHLGESLDFSWSLLDYGMGYYGARQQANRVLIAAEKRRKAMHLLMQDVRTAYWRAASAQRLRGEVAEVIATAEEALNDSRKAEAERLRNPLDALRYQRQLLENLRLLESINNELSSAQLELASLINAPLGQTIQIADGDARVLSPEVLKIPLATLEEAALAGNADLGEQQYNARIARDETRKVFARLFPNVSLNYSLQYDSDSYLVNRDWQEAGLHLSFNLFNLLTGENQMKLAKAGVSLADQRRMATQLTVLTQVHLARLQLLNTRSQFERADAIYSTDNKIAEHVKNREAAQAQSKLDRVSNGTASILSLLRRYQALAQVESAENRLLATLGLEPQIGSTSELSLEQLGAQLGQQDTPWLALQSAATPASTPSNQAK